MRSIREVQGTRTLVEQIRAGTADSELSAIVVAVYDRQAEVVKETTIKRLEIMRRLQAGEGTARDADAILDAMYQEVGLT